MIDERSPVVFAAHGLTLCEFFLMCAADDRIPLVREPFIATAKALSDGDPRGECSIEQFAAALDRLLARGWLAILRPEDIEAEDERRARATVPELLDSGYDAGAVDFTAAGYAVHRAVIRGFHGDEHLARKDRGFNLDDAARRFDVYATLAELCAELMDTIVADGEGFTGREAVRFVERLGPAPTGPWRPNRFVTLPSGWHGALRFVCAD